jgi:hypothetical protein
MKTVTLQPASEVRSIVPAPELRAALSILVLVGLLPLISAGCGPPF